MTYCSLADAIRHLRAGKSSANLTQQVERDVLLAMLRRAPRIDNIFTSRGWRYFEPNVDTVAFELRPTLINSRRNSLDLPEPLLELSGTKINGSSVTGVQTLPPGVTAGIPTPYRKIYLNNNCRTWYNAVCAACTACPPAQWVEISGVWGVSREYSYAWQEADSVQNAGGVSMNDTSITVSDADGEDFEGATPRFSPGQLLKIDDEYLRLDDVNNTTDTLTVRRAQNGSSATAHAFNAAILVWQPDRGIREEYARQVAQWYARIGAFNTVEVSAVTGGEIRFPDDLMASLKGALQGYVNYG